MTTYDGTATSTVPGIAGTSSFSNVLAIRGISSQYYGIYGQAAQNSTAGVYGYNTATSGTGVGVSAVTNTASGYGLYCQGPGFALYCAGDGQVTGDFGVDGVLYGYDFYGSAISGTSLYITGSKNFLIDHPLDPANKELMHACVESSELKNIYDGMGKADPAGELLVQMPAYFEALNKEFRYQLTAIGKPSPGLHVKDELANGTFRIGGAAPGQSVCWQVTGNRRDAYAEANPIVVEREKLGDAKGLFHNPEAHGHSSDKGIDAARRKARTPPVPPQLGPLP